MILPEQTTVNSVVLFLIQLSKIPYILVIGDREEEQGGAAVRLRTGDDLGAKPAAEIIELILAAVAAGN